MILNNFASFFKRVMIIHMNNILKSIGADYLLEMYDFKGIELESIITPDLLSIAQKDIKGNFNEYLKSHELEKQIKQVSLHYFFAIYLMTIFGVPNNIDGPFVKSKLREFITEKNKISYLHKNLPNFDFHLGSCGMEAEKLANKFIENNKKPLV